MEWRVCCVLCMLCSGFRRYVSNAFYMQCMHHLQFSRLALVAVAIGKCKYLFQINYGNVLFFFGIFDGDAPETRLSAIRLASPALIPFSPLFRFDKRWPGFWLFVFKRHISYFKSISFGPSHLIPSWSGCCSDQFHLMSYGHDPTGSHTYYNPLPYFLNICRCSRCEIMA